MITFITYVITRFFLIGQENEWHDHNMEVSHLARDSHLNKLNRYPMKLIIKQPISQKAVYVSMIVRTILSLS